MSKKDAVKKKDCSQYFYLIDDSGILPSLTPYLVGREQCSPGHYFGPSVRRYTIVHYIQSGKGYFEKDGKRYDLSAGDAFVICKGDTTFYKADDNDPWKYYWLGFYGELSERFRSLASPILHIHNSAIFTDAVEMAESGSISTEYMLSKIFELMHEAFCGSKTVARGDSIEKAVHYISLNYASHISVERIAEILGFDRSYLSRLFRKRMGTTVNSYIINTRMQHAVEYLKVGKTVKEVSKLVGYDDQFTFSRMFKKAFGMAPSEYRP